MDWNILFCWPEVPYHMDNSLTAWHRLNLTLLATSAHSRDQGCDIPCSHYHWVKH
jgi:hypothetical protein